VGEDAQHDHGIPSGVVALLTKFSMPFLDLQETSGGNASVV